METIIRARSAALILCGAIVVWVGIVDIRTSAQASKSLSVAFINGNWFNDATFDARTVYSIDGRLTFRSPARVDRTLDLSGAYVVPPFAEAHNHNIGLGSEERDKQSVLRYLAEGVFYVKIHGNLPLTKAAKARLSINRPEGVDVVFAQGALTATGGHPISLVENVLLPAGLYAGYTKETLKDHYYFTIDSERELEKKWSRIQSLHPDFIKTFLLFSEDFERRRAEATYFGQKGLDPRLLSKIVKKAHSANLRVATHVTTGADFHKALAAGVDEIAHVPSVGDIAADDARLAARRHVVVDTTSAVPVPTLIRMGVVNEIDVRRTEATNLKVLIQNGVTLAVGSDDVTDTSRKEVEYLKRLGLFDNLSLLKLWTTTAQTIFPKRRIGALREGYEASFLALEGNPLTDFENVHRIRLRVKQGFVLEL